MSIKKCPKPDFFLGLKENPTVNVLSKTVTCTTQNLDEHNLHKNTSNDDDDVKTQSIIKNQLVYLTKTLLYQIMHHSITTLL